jgi:glycine cleavage system H protein
MPTVRGCHLPDELLYDVPRQLWYREEPGGLVRAGITSVACAMAGQIFAVTTKRVGRQLAANEACAVCESGKVVGAAKVGFAAEVVEANEALMDAPDAINHDPYGSWLVVLGPQDWSAAKAALTPGSAVAAPYEALMEAEGFEGCGGS